MLYMSKERVNTTVKITKTCSYIKCGWYRSIIRAKYLSCRSMKYLRASIMDSIMRLSTLSDLLQLFWTLSTYIWEMWEGNMGSRGHPFPSPNWEKCNLEICFYTLLPHVPLNNETVNTMDWSTLHLRDLLHSCMHNFLVQIFFQVLSAFINLRTLKEYSSPSGQTGRCSTATTINFHHQDNYIIPFTIMTHEYVDAEDLDKLAWSCCTRRNPQGGVGGVYSSLVT